MHIILISADSHYVEFIKQRLKNSLSQQSVIGNIKNMLHVELKFIPEFVEMFMISIQNVACLNPVLHWVPSSNQKLNSDWISVMSLYTLYKMLH
jgi:hypothetical protein